MKNNRSKNKFRKIILTSSIALIFTACADPDCHKQMVTLLKKVNKQASVPHNIFAASAKMPYMDSLFALPRSTDAKIKFCKFLKAQVLLELGKEDQAIELLSAIETDNEYSGIGMTVIKELALTHLRLGERSNCVMNHASMSCILPIRGMGIHNDPAGSRKAAELYEKVLTKNPNDLESR